MSMSVSLHQFIFVLEFIEMLKDRKYLKNSYNSVNMHKVVLNHFFFPTHFLNTRDDTNNEIVHNMDILQAACRKL